MAAQRVYEMVRSRVHMATGAIFRDLLVPKGRGVCRVHANVLRVRQVSSARAPIYVHSELSAPAP